MNIDRTPIGAEIEVIEDWLHRFGDVQETPSGLAVTLTPELLRDYAEWVAACLRECIAQVLESMDDGVWANHCGPAIRQMRGDH